MKYSETFERDFKWYLSVRRNFNFDGAAEYCNNTGEDIIQYKKTGASGKEAFYLWDSKGVIKPTKHPNLLHCLLKTKGSVNLHIKMYAQSRADGTLPKIEFREWCNDWKAPAWFKIAVENQKGKYY